MQLPTKSPEQPVDRQQYAFRSWVPCIDYFVCTVAVSLARLRAAQLEVEGEGWSVAPASAADLTPIDPFQHHPYGMPVRTVARHQEWLATQERQKHAKYDATGVFSPRSPRVPLCVPTRPNFGPIFHH